MKKNFNNAVMLIACIAIFSISCKKHIDQPVNSNSQTKTFSSDVAIKWLNMQLRILKIVSGPSPFGLNPSRYFAYCGVALYESVVPGMPAYQSISGQLTGMPAMPAIIPGMAYHWATCANAALAYMNKSFFPATSAENIASIDSLENALNTKYQTEANAETIQRSADFGKAVAQLIFEWSKTDGSLTVYPTYVPPVGTGLWAPTPPNFPAAAGPYWGNNRLFVQGSLNNSAPPAPPVYSTDPASAYYAMVKEVYDVSQTLTPEQTAIALYYRDSPGYLSGSHYISIFMQVLQGVNPQLDIAALAYAKTGISAADAFIGCWKVKYQYNVERPIKYIREVLNHPSWNPLFNTPGHPDFPSGHSTNGGAVEEALSGLFGANYQFTNHTYDYMGMASRTYISFADMADEVGRSRVYAGIHYALSCTAGRQQGKKIAQNINSNLKFSK